MKHSFFKGFISFALITGCMLNMTACSFTDITDRFYSKEALYEKLHASPRFWYDALPIEGTSNQYKLESEYFRGKPYNNIVAFGDNLLLVGQGIYNQGSHLFKDRFNDGDPDDEEGFDDSEEPGYEFSFEVYDPWKNSITATLSHTSISCDDYRVCGDKLYLINSEDETISEYDLELNFVDTYQLSKLFNRCELNFYSGIDNTYYEKDNIDNAILKINSSDFSSEVLDVGLYSPLIQSVSDDGKFLLTSGVDKVDLKYKNRVFSTEDMSILSEINGKSFGASSVSDSGFIFESDYKNNIWNYHSFDGADSFFKVKNLQDVSIINDNGIIFHKEKDPEKEKSSEHLIKYFYTDTEGNSLSSFEFNCDNSDINGYQYLARNYVYLEDCNSIFYLVYTENCMPYILIWKLDDPANTDFDLAYDMDSIDKDKKKPSKKEEGTTVTLIDDPENYYWNELADANSAATKLEDKYNISIYLGPEVPSQINYFKCTQENNVATVTAGLEALKNIMYCYPDNFFQQLCYGNLKGIRFYLTGEITGGTDGYVTEPSGFATEINDYMVLAIDLSQLWNLDYTINHEISHMIDRRLDFLSKYNSDAAFSESKWVKLNPKGCKYVDGYENYENSDAYKNHPEYFFDSYGTTFATEDRAEIFGHAMDYYLNELDAGYIFNPNSPLTKKLKFYCQCIRDGFDTTGWDSQLPWEKFN